MTIDPQGKPIPSPPAHPSKAAHMLEQALEIAKSGQTCLVLVPTQIHARAALNYLAHLVHDQGLHHITVHTTDNTVQVNGTGGSVRIYLTSHPEWDPRMRRLRSYPVGTPMLLPYEDV